ncbi:MAG: cytochrome c [Candidatus Eisenbacteria bacterium]
MSFKPPAILRDMPRWALPTLAILVSLSFIPIALIARARAVNFRHPRIHLIPDMDQQFKYKSQSFNPLFLDGRSMRMPIDGTVARGELASDDHLYRGMVDGEWATTFPMSVTPELMARGQQRFGIYCSPCHGLSGNGQGTVAQRADALQMATWVPPASVHSDLVRSRPVGHLFNTITNGIRTMPPYGPQISVGDRWAIVAYVRALQRSQHATIDDVPPDMRSSLR